jgi:hypothetical protein
MREREGECRHRAGELHEIVNHDISVLMDQIFEWSGSYSDAVIIWWTSVVERHKQFYGRAAPVLDTPLDHAVRDLDCRWLSEGQRLSLVTRAARSPPVVPPIASQRSELWIGLHGLIIASVRRTRHPQFGRSVCAGRSG